MDRLATKAPLIHLLAGCIVFCERVLPKLPPEEVAASLVACFVTFLMFIVVKRAPSVQLDAQSNEMTTTIRTGPDDDVRAQFKHAERVARAEQRRLRGYRGRSHGPARHARSTYFAYLEVLHGMRPAAIPGHWLELTTRWVAGAGPQTSSPEEDAYIEWRANGRQLEVLEASNIAATLRAWRARHQGSEVTLGLAADVAVAG
jgi:hypothetical protein